MARKESINEYQLCGVGDAHTLDEWIHIIFFRNYETAKDFFSDFTEKEIVDYLICNYRLRLEKTKEDK